MARAKRTYTEDDKIAVYVALQANDNNVTRTARETGVPEPTIRSWRKVWEAEGPPDVTAVAEAAADFIEEAERVRNLALKTIEEKMPGATVSALIAVVGVLDDKITRSRGLASSRSEVVHRHELPAAEDLKDAIREVAAKAMEIAVAREADIIDAEIVEEQALALPVRV